MAILDTLNERCCLISDFSLALGGLAADSAEIARNLLHAAGHAVLIRQYPLKRARLCAGQFRHPGEIIANPDKHIGDFAHGPGRIRYT